MRTTDSGGGAGPRHRDAIRAASQQGGGMAGQPHSCAIVVNMVQLIAIGCAISDLHGASADDGPGTWVRTDALGGQTGAHRLEFGLDKFMTPLSFCRAPRRRRILAAAAMAVLCCWPGAGGVTAAAAGRADAGAALPTADSVPDPGVPGVPAPDDGAAQQGGPGCAAWTDRCVTCERRAEGRVSCSNIGIACQPQAVQCVRGETAQQRPPDPEKDGN